MGKYTFMGLLSEPIGNSEGINTGYIKYSHKTGEPIDHDLPKGKTLDNVLQGLPTVNGQETTLRV